VERLVSIAIRFVGGPADGRTLTISGDQPPPLYLIPKAQPIADLVASSFEPTPTQADEYEPLRQNGWPRRTDDGAYLYGYRATPATAEQRRTVEAARHEAQVAEAERAALLDETWREIRRERPHYPENWRDI
jgi:hypothetical protein